MRAKRAKRTPPGYAPDVDATARIERFGGASAEKARIDITTDLAPDHASFVINTIGTDGRQLVWNENLVWLAAVCDAESRGDRG